MAGWPASMRPPRPPSLFRPCSSKTSWSSLAKVATSSPCSSRSSAAWSSTKPAYSVRVRQWPGQEVTFSKMAGQTGEFVARLRENRGLLAQEASTTLAAALPKLPAGGRAALSGMWLPGRLMEVEGMEAVCPGFGQGFREAWLARLERREEGLFLLDGLAGGAAWLGCTREQAEGERRGGGRTAAVAAGRQERTLVPRGALDRRPRYLLLRRGRRGAGAGVTVALCATVLQGGALQPARRTHRRQCRVGDTGAVPGVPGGAAEQVQDPGDPPVGRRLEARRGGVDEAGG